MKLLKTVAYSILMAAALAAPASAAPGMIGAGHDPGVAVDAAGTAHVAWFAEPAGGDSVVQYCQVPRGRRSCAVTQTLAVGQESGTGQVQVLVPRPGTVYIVAPLLNSPGVLFGSADNGATFAARPIGEWILIEQAVFGPGDGIGLISRRGSFGRYGVDGSGPASPSVSFGSATESLSTSLAPWGGGLAAFLGGVSVVRSIVWNGLGDPNLPQSWVEGPRMGKRLAASAMGGRSGTWVAYSDRRGGRSELRVRKLRTSGRYGPSRRVAGDDPTVIHSAQGPRGDMIVLWREVSDEVKYVRSRNGRRWTRPRKLIRGNEPEDVRPVLGRRGGWAVWDAGCCDGPIRIAALPRAPRR
jgi:hypothetical protein